MATTGKCGDEKQGQKKHGTYYNRITFPQEKAREKERQKHQEGTQVRQVKALMIAV